MRVYMGLLVFLGAVLLLGGAASAQEARAEDEQQAWEAYRSAFRMCAASELVRCEQALEELVQAWPQHPAAELARGSLEDLQSIKALVVKAEEPRRGINGERFTSLARGELISAQTLHGVVLGSELCLAVDCELRPTLAMLMLGGGGGLALSWLGSSGGITPGHALVLNSGTTVGGFTAAMISFELDAFSDERGYFYMALGQGLGMGAGELYYRTLKPTVGQVALTNSGGLWTSGLYLLGLEALDIHLDSDDTTTSVTVMLNLGLVGGGVLAHYFPMSRSRVTMLDTSGLLGGLVSVGTYALVQDSKEADDQTITSLAMLGGVVGLGLGTWLTQGWDNDDEDVKREKRSLISMSPVPTRLLAPADGRDREGWGLQLSARW